MGLPEGSDLCEKVFECAPVGLMAVGLDGTLLRVNPALAALAARSPDQLVGRRVGELLTGPGGDAGFVAYALADAPSAREGDLARQDGEPLRVRVSAGVARDEAGGRPMWVLGVVETAQAVDEPADARASFAERVLAILDLADDLLACPDLDALYRRAVELARERLGAERCAIFLYEDGVMRGTYGTDGEGRTTDERGHRVPEDHFYSRFGRSAADREERWQVSEAPQTYWTPDGLETVGTGWLAAAAIRTPERFIGAFTHDAAITRAPCDEGRLQILALYCSLLASIIERRQAEDRHERVSRGLREVVLAANDLMACPDADTLHRRAVELARERLGVERCSLFIREGQRSIGTYGTDMDGRTTDERRAVQAVGVFPEWQSPKEGYLWGWERAPRREWDGETYHEGLEGWIAHTPVVVDGRVVAVFYNDAAISGAPLDEALQDALAAYCTLLGRILEGRAAEEALAVSERRHRALLDALPQKVFFKNRDLRYGYVNKAYAEGVGRTPEDILGLTAEEVHPEPQARQFTDDDVRFMAEPRPIAYETVETASGEERVVHTEKTPVFDADGELDGVLGIHWDVTEARRAARAVEESEARLRALIENVDDLIVVIDPAYRIAFCSPSVERLLGYAPDEVLGQPAESYIHPDDLALVSDRFTEAPSQRIQMDFRTRHKDGGWRLFAMVGFVPPEGSPVGGMVVTCRDMTERRELERRALQSSRLEALGTLSGGIAHDFNNLLTGILGYTEVLSGPGASFDRVAQGLRAIHDLADRASTLTRQLLAFSRQQPVNVAPLDMNLVIAELGELLRRVIGESIHVELRLAPGLTTISADRGHIEQILMNLFVNARDAMPSGGTLTVETRLVEAEVSRAGPLLAPGPWVEILVRDTGAGMDATTQARAFDPFFTTKAPGKGTGLGLATAYGVVHQHGGHIFVQSAVGQGTEFMVYFPPCGTPSAKPLAEAVAALPRGGTETILVAEDEASVRELVRDVLTEFGYTVLAAPDPDQAEELARKHGERIAMLLSDVAMPGRSGAELRAALAATLPGLKVLFMSGYALRSGTDAGDAIAGYPYIQKPFSATELVSRVREVLDGSERA